VTVLEGARLITGDASVIDNSSFVVDGNRIVAVGRRGEARIPAGAARVDLTGKTVIPALIDARIRHASSHRTIGQGRLPCVD
jgi:imidazolonepropionase-like amidohydrolase